MTNNVIPFPRRSSEPAPAAPAGPALASAEQLSEQLSAGWCPPDASFDQFLAEPLRGLSAQHWTPLVVALRAAEWFGEYRIRTVLDVGSGAGKFCVAAALASHCHFTGLEHREGLVSAARALARTFKVESRAHFIHGALGAVRLPAADAYYLYNPFEENVMEPGGRIDHTVELSRRRQARDLDLLREVLASLRPGTYVMTYNGCGLRMPANYRLLCTDRELPSVLCLWRKASPRLMAGRNRSDGLCPPSPDAV